MQGPVEPEAGLVFKENYSSAGAIQLHVEHGSKARRPSSTSVSLRNSGRQEQNNNNHLSPTIVRLISRIFRTECRKWT
jgi:hypothetical protein